MQDVETVAGWPLSDKGLRCCCDDQTTATYRD
jgi:hypothetical protein